MKAWKIAAAVVAAIVAVNVGLRILETLTGGTPGGPRSSSYATAPAGLRAYAELLAASGHRVRRDRGEVADALADGVTLVLLDPAFVTPDDARRLRRFVERGGHLVAGGLGRQGWLRRVLDEPPVWEDRAVRRAAPIAPLPELRRSRHVDAAGEGAYVATGEAVPALGNGSRTLLAVAVLGRGRVLLLADPSPLQNRLLARADNAALGLALAGSRARPVVFAEGAHGYGRETGFASIPGRWVLALAGLLLAAVLFAVAHARRLGPPEPEPESPPPPRRLHVESLAAILARAGADDEAADPLRSRIRTLAGEPGASLTSEERALLETPVTGEADLIALARLLGRLERRSTVPA